MTQVEISQRLRNVFKFAPVLVSNKNKMDIDFWL